jgi:Ion transport protein
MEALLKILALGMVEYLKDKWNCFDIVIVLLSLVELGLANVKGLSILRSFRLVNTLPLSFVIRIRPTDRNLIL